MTLVHTTFDDVSDFIVWLSEPLTNRRLYSDDEVSEWELIRKYEIEECHCTIKTLHDLHTTL